MRWFLLVAILSSPVPLLIPSALWAQAPESPQLPGSAALEITDELYVVMTRGMSAHAERELVRSRDLPSRTLNLDHSSPEALEASKAPYREKLRQLIGAVDPRIEHPSFWERSLLDSRTRELEAGINVPVTWPVIEGVTGTGILIRRTDSDRPSQANAIIIGDFAHTPEDLLGLTKRLLPTQQFARRFVENECDVLAAVTLDRRATTSAPPEVRKTNLSHREYIYRLGHELGRHPLGYEVQKILSAIDVMQAESSDLEKKLPVILVGIGDGAPVAMYAAALDSRVDACVVSGYFGPREEIWKEPIDRNVWNLLTSFGDAEVAGLIAPRLLIVDVCNLPLVTGPTETPDGVSRIAAPGVTVNRSQESLDSEIERAKRFFADAGAQKNLRVVDRNLLQQQDACVEAVVEGLNLIKFRHTGKWEVHRNEAPDAPPIKPSFEEQRGPQQMGELVRHTQTLLHRSDKVRASLWNQFDRSSVEKWNVSAQQLRDRMHDELIGRLPRPSAPLNPRSRKVIDTPTHVGYEVMLDVYTDTIHPADSAPSPLAELNRQPSATVIAGGILLIPKDLKPGEQRPVVVCQHGLEGTPMDTITTDQSQRAWAAYKGFSTQLVQRGFIVYAPQNPYKGYDDFRVIQRKANPLGRTLFSYIVEQHRQTLKWLETLPYVDRDRIGFYGLSYGGKTAVRVPPLLPPTESEPGYCLSICSADFNEWIRKNASAEDRYSYVYTPEYEIWEWNMGHLAGYAELASLMAPRPFMVERGHDDGVAPDEWVGWEFAKVRRHYDKLGIGDRAEIEWFNGPHTINGQGTFRFLHQHLNWPSP